jgi:colanic acid/amylovoran biosynthesis glycosyltransferase
MAALTYLGCPVVISCRGSQINVYPHDPNYRGYRDQLPQIFSRATAVHCVSEAIKLEASKYGLDPRKTQVIYPAVNPNFFQPASWPKAVTASPFRIIMVGALGWVKGFEFALLAVKQLIEEQLPVHLDIIGDGPERQRVLYTIEDLQLQEVVHLHAQFTPEQVRDKLQQSHAFLLASLSEGVSNAALEAMACGLPVVTTDCGGMREAVANSVEGFVVPGGDVVATAVALKQLITNPGLCQRMGQAGRQRICQQFTLTQQIEAFVSLFRSCIS